MTTVRLPNYYDYRGTRKAALPPPRRAFTTGEAAAICGVAPRTVAKWFDSGRLRGYRIPGSDDRRIPYEAMERFLRNNGLPLAGFPFAGGVLIVTPDEALAARLASSLPDCAHAPTGFRAGVLSRDRHSAALLDFAMGRWECLLIAGSLKQAQPDIRLVALANEDEPEDLARFGFDAQFRHPADPARLAAALAGAAKEETPC